MAEEKPFLLVRLCVHCDKTTTRSEEDNVLIGDLRPLKVQALLW